MKQTKNHNRSHTTSAEGRSRKHSQAYIKAANFLLYAATFGVGFPAMLTGGMMLANRESDPATAFQDLKDRFAYTFGEDLCPPAPTQSEREKTIQNINSLLTFRNTQEAMAQAESRGLHFAKNIEVFRNLNVAKNAATATEIASQYTKENFGFDLKLSLPEGTLESSEATEHYKRDLTVFTLYTSLFPRELLEGANITTVTIKDVNSKIVVNGQETTAVGMYTPDNHNAGDGKVELDLTVLRDPTVLVHEVLGHGIHNSACGGYNGRDNGFTAFNPNNFHYANGGYVDEANVGTVTASIYGAQNHEEDVAETIAGFVFNTTTSEGYTWGAPITDKLAVTLSRMDEIAPGSAEYLASMRNSFIGLAEVMNAVPPYDYFNQQD